MNETAIRWTELTWNPASGCKKISPGCKHCYAETLAENKRGTPAFPKGFDLTLRPHKMTEPFKVKQPSMIFVNSMSDLFWEEISDEYRDQVLDVIEATPHEFQVLTKRHENLLRYSKRRRLPSNFWAGVTAEDNEWAQKRGEVLLQVKADIRFMSLEPALGPIDLRPLVAGRNNAIGGDGIQWVIYGGESGLHLTKPDVREKRGIVDQDAAGKWIPRPSKIAEVTDICNVCVDNGVAFFFKQWGGPRSHSGGKMLNGRAWEEYPRTPPAAWTAEQLAAKDRMGGGRTPKGTRPGRPLSLPIIDREPGPENNPQEGLDIFRIFR
jgi:protein gp37